MFIYYVVNKAGGPEKSIKIVVCGMISDWVECGWVGMCFLC